MERMEGGGGGGVAIIKLVLCNLSIESSKTQPIGCNYRKMG